jgi:bis(5'-nucleosyl)-tetraphosphatase (symmetrical)
MYGSKPNTWSSNLTGYDRLRYIVNAYTRMRFCGPDGKLEFKYNGASSNAPTGMKPWFQWPAHKRNHKVVFGHWAALMGMTQTADFIALDSGYVWGNYLTLMNLDTKVRYLCDIDNNITEIGETDFLKLEHPL